MSKPSSELFASTIGLKANPNLLFWSIKLPSTKLKTKSDTSYINPHCIRYSQTSVNGSNEIIESMRKNGWQGDPIDVVKMNDGELTTLDNTRVVAARIAGIKVKAKVHNYNDPLPDIATMQRFTTKKGGTPMTWGQAVENRIGKQSSGFRKTYPNGSYKMNRIK